MILSINEQKVISQARMILEEKAKYGAKIESPKVVKELLLLRNCDRKNEVFSVIFLTNAHETIAIEDMFQGTIDIAQVYPRVIAERALELGAAALILAHNHPSGNTEPSSADIAITNRITDALNLLDIRVIDHIITGGNDTLSMAEKGFI